MRKIKLFLSLLILATFGISNAWAEEVKWDLKTTSYSSSTDAEVIWSSSYVTATAIQGDGTKVTNYLAKSSQTRLYNKNTLSITPVSGYSINSIVITATGNSYVIKGTWTNGTSSTSGSIVTITPTDGTKTISCAISATCCLTEIKVLYESTSGGSETPVASLTVNPTTIDFGTVYQGADVESKTVAVNFANLTGNVTYSGLNTPFTATGAISATGDKITISADASTIGEYSQTLTVASTADSKTAEVIVKMNVVEKPAPTGTFTLHTGDLIEGDYVIVSTNALKAEVNSDRLASLPVTISGNDIVDPDATTIWHIAKNGEYWTLYNANKAKYAASTGAKNKAALLDAGTDDKALWSVTGTSTYEFVNKKNTAAAVNANLRYNSQNAENSRWACYSTSTGGALSLYRKAGAKYNVTVNSTTNGSVTASPTSAEAGTTITLTVTPETGYVLDALTVTDASSNTVTVTNNEFTMPASDVTVTATFKENEKPAATLTLSKNGETEDITGYKQDDKVILPSITSGCVKAFVGWSADADCATEPEYKEGDEYTLAATAQTLYAVYATVDGGGETTVVNSLSSNGWTDAKQYKSLQIDANVKAAVTGGGNTGKYYTSGTNWRLYQNEDAKITISTTLGELKSVKFTFTNSNSGTLLYGSTTLTSGNAVSVSGTSATFTVGNSGSATNGQIRISKIEVVYTGGVSYSNYSTTCAAALANPTFSLAAGKYTEAKSVTISATEGTVYYTTDGTTPTALSTQYTGAIALNDCGEYTIKAIAISSDSYSDVVSATYTIKLPLTNSQAAPYTEAEAIAVYDGDCYDNQDVYVKGTVKTATFYSSGTYTITLTNGFQFYKFYKDGSKTLFTDGEINKGDVLVACGKLSKYNTNYQLAEGCYLVEHEPYTEPKTDISNTEATAYTVGQAFALIADVSSDLTKEVFVKGLVAVAPTSNPTADGQMTYKISDNGENTGNVLTVYLGLNLNGEKFTSKNDVQQGDYVVVKGKLLDYNSTYELNKGNQLVQHVKAATITIADITMEVGETKTIAATIVPAEAEVTYTIKENAANAISLSGNTITANAVGTATITATIATAAEYMGKTVEFKVTVTPKTEKTDVVILAELDGNWYAMKGAVPSGKSNQLDAIEVTYFNGTLYNVPDEVKASITWTRSVVDGKATFVNNGKYLKGGASTDLTLVGTVDNNCKWMWNDENGYYTTNTSGTIRTFLYRENYNFKNYGVSQAGKEDADGNYSSLPVVTAPVYKTETLYTIKATAENGTVIGAGIYEAGAKVTLTADPAMDYTFVNWTKGGEVVSIANPFVFEATENLDLVANFTAISQTSKTLSGKFSTGEYEYAEFATGNLQYHTDGTWGFAKQQYQYIGNANINVGDPAFTGTIDMFGWSTSETNYGVDPRNENVYYDGAFVDWSNLFPGEGWSTLSADQWKYLLNTRTNASSLKQIARVGSVVGIMLFPDNWNETPVVEAKYDSYYELYMYNYSITQWTTLEAKGALFLPAAGRRTGGYGNTINKEQIEETENLNDGYYRWQDNTNIYCYYWTSTINETTKNVAYLHNITDLGNDEYTIGTGAVWSEKGRYGQSVRLAKVTKYYTREVDPQYYGTICLAKAAKFEGGSLYEVSYFDESTKKVYFDEIENGVMEAGMPYVFLAEKNVICAYYTSDTEKSAQNKAGLYGTLVDITSGMNADGVYMIYRNQIIHSTNPGSYLNANRAYIKLTEVPGYNDPLFVAPAPVPGRKRISMGTQATNTATGVDEVQGNNVQSTKVLMDGTLYIFRNGKMYDAQGKLVK